MVAPTAPLPSRLLTISIFARNDQYMGNFKYRLSTTLNYLARNLKALGRLEQVEAVITDWNSDAPLAGALQLTPEAVRISRFIQVPPSIAGQFTPMGKAMNLCVAANTSVRRAQGRFIMMADSDTLMPIHSLHTLMSLLEGELPLPLDPTRALFIAGRYQIPEPIVRREPTLEAWDRFLLLNSWEIPLERGYAGLGTHGSGQLMHRDLWHASRGYNESFKAAAWLDAELTLRITQEHPWFNLSSLGIPFFHMEHGSGNLFSGNRYLVSPTFQVNDEAWGLGGLELEEAAGGTGSPAFVGDPTGDSIPNSIADTTGSISGVQARTDAGGPGSRVGTKALRSDLDAMPSLPIWNISGEELVAELMGQDVRRQVKGVRSGLEKFLGYLGDEANRESRLHQQLDLADIAGLKHLLHFDRETWAAMYALCWFSRFHAPDRYLELGVQQWIAPAFVAALRPMVEIYGIDAWRTGVDHPVPSNYFLNQLLQAFRYRGYLRYITGEPSTGLERLDRSSLTSLTLDLILFRVDVVGNAAERVLELGLNRLRPGGGLVLTATADDRFEALWQGARQSRSDWTFVRFRDTCTGLIVKATLVPMAGYDQVDDLVTGIVTPTV